MKSPREFLILTNNELVGRLLGEKYELALFGQCSYREILVRARDLIYLGHRLYTHPLAGSVKPNETPYRSIVLSRRPHGFSADEAAIIAESIATFDKFTPRARVWTDELRDDFRLIDYTLLCGALDLDPTAGFSDRSQI